MVDVRPFRALRPRDDLAASVIAPPYDVLTDAEARSLAQTATSFVHVTRAEVDLPIGSDPHSTETYQMAARNLRAFIDQGILVQDDHPTYYVYGQRMGAHRQVGLIAGASVTDYDNELIRKHELTRPDKELDRTEHIEHLNAQVGLVFLTHAPSAALNRVVEQVVQAPPAWRVTSEDGVEHDFWPCPPAAIEPIREAFAQLPALYIADGHHRCAAASRVHAKRQRPETAHMLAGLFPADQLYVMAYNRVVDDLAGHSPEAFIERLNQHFIVTATDQPVPEQRGVCTMYFQGAWFTLEANAALRAQVEQKGDPVATLDVAVLQDHVLAPILDIHDPRRSKRIHFLGGIRGPQALKAAVDNGAAVAFHMFPTGLDQLFAVADAAKMMPPKSTWFEPKLREGVAIRSLDKP